VVTSAGGVDILGRPLGTDFSSFYAAGQAVLAGHPAEPFDPALLHARQQALFGPATPFYAWQYPPMFLLVVAPFALLPYAIAWAVWQSLTLAFTSSPSGPSSRARSGPPRRHPAPAVVAPCPRLPCGLPDHRAWPERIPQRRPFRRRLALVDRKPWLAGILFGS